MSICNASVTKKYQNCGHTKWICVWTKLITSPHDTGDFKVAKRDAPQKLQHSLLLEQQFPSANGPRKDAPNCRKQNHQIPDKKTERSGTIRKHQRIVLFFVTTKVKRPIHLQGKKSSFQKKTWLLLSPLVFAFKNIYIYILHYLNFGMVLPFVKSLHKSFWDRNPSAPNLDTNSSGSFLKLCLRRFAIHLSFSKAYKVVEDWHCSQKKRRKYSHHGKIGKNLVWKQKDN